MSRICIMEVRNGDVVGGKYSEIWGFSTGAFHWDSTDAPMISWNRTLWVFYTIFASVTYVDPLQICKKRNNCAKQEQVSKELRLPVVENMSLGDTYKLLLCRTLYKISYCNPKGRSLNINCRLCMVIGKTESQIY